MNVFEILTNQVTLLSEMKPSDAIWLFLIPASLAALELFLLIFSKSKEKMVRVDLALSLVVFFVCYAILLLSAGLWLLVTDQKSYAMEKPSLIAGAVNGFITKLMYSDAMQFSQAPNPPSIWPAPCQPLLENTFQMAAMMVIKNREQARSELAAAGQTPPTSFDLPAKADAYETRVIQRMIELSEQQLATPQGLAELCAKYAKLL
ncbi:MAG: hypothetical protein IPI58_05410 [Alphaproteobacteria bacterium]|nr:MAG: hypothetical protein IPI58_05410 [Alphaproteobacteria bacterium]